ncbi:MAG TPA: hypothetical protein EYP56_07470 [Planctomycetaceae bacterium]|nr:hypothetical protein [Planctomycetaceae bacterium]
MAGNPVRRQAREWQRETDGGGAVSQDLEMPIVVTGMARSGTTWVQWFLSEHPRIHIHGQEPKLHWADLWHWYQKLVEHGRWAVRANRLQGYGVPHYAGSGPQRCREIFKRLVREYMTGLGPPVEAKPRWGLKWIGLAARGEAAWQFASLWPEARWVVCVREPFAAMASLKNTFAPELDVRQFAASWVATCRFIEACDRGRLAVVQLDKLAGEGQAGRKAGLDEVLECVGEEPSEETDEFIRQWPVVHKVKPDEERSFRFTGEEKQRLVAEVPGLAEQMEKMGHGWE